MHYGESFVPIYDNILTKLKEPNGKGIVLLHGIPGTGKTSLIKHIAKNIEKEIIFIPPSMAESLTDPNFLTFMLGHQNCVLIIEDAERVVSSREGVGSAGGVSNILNISDGILGDCLNIQIVATFNTKRSEIDEALLRKGRLIAEHEFGALSKDNSTKLLKALGKDVEATKPMILAEIYGYGEAEFRESNGRRKVGFIHN
jgi:ATP-dependent 26S proteasome regulatory subunit